ncbi:MAG: carbohydrate-binding domain-containing protein [Clostridia bacterium]|nr:carbohydrate-binding domain-containing protein [Clostridia bacterium]
MKKRIFILLIAALTAFSLTSCGRGDSGTETTVPAPSVQTDIASDCFSDADFRDVTGETPNAEITLSGGEGSISDSTRGSSGATVRVTSKGVYRVTGSSTNVTIEICDETESGNIYLVLDRVTMTNETAPCILIERADKVILQPEGTNALTYMNRDASVSADGAIYAKHDLTVYGAGSLNVTSSLHGIVCRNDLKITGGTLGVAAERIGLKADSSVCVGGGSTIVKAGRDGVRVKSSASDGCFAMTGGILTVSAGSDGISADAAFLLSDGAVTVTAGGGSDNAKNGGVSQKGIKCGDFAASGGSLNVSAADDAVHCDHFAVSGGSFTLSSSDDGVHADSAIAVSGGEISVSKSYEGLEAQTVAIAGGTLVVHASDDGVNAAGGSDEDRETNAPRSGFAGEICVSGGSLYINAEGDGIDSNGSIRVSGGTVIVEGPSNDRNGALDKGDGADCVAEITGGTVLALGSSGMAINFDSGSQCSALVTIGGEAGAAVSVDDGSDFAFIPTKRFSSAVYSSPQMKKGNAYTFTAGASSVKLDFSKGLYYKN